MAKTAIITGASSGIGKACVKAFYEAGYNVVLFSNQWKEQQDSIKAFKLDKSRVLSVFGDVANEVSVKRMIRLAVSRFKSIDVLVNNAGFGIFKEIDKLSRKEFDSQFQVNVTGLFLCTKHILPIMKKQDSGQIINMASMAGIYAFATGTAYCASKWAVRGFTMSLKDELRATKIKVGMISPGSVDTPFQKKAMRSPSPDRLLRPEDVALQVYNLAEQPAHSDIDEIIVRPAYVPFT